MRKKSTEKKVPVSVRALYQRINRKLRATKGGETLKATRGNKFRDHLGDFYMVSAKTNMLVENDVDLSVLGKKLGVLKPWETLISGENLRKPTRKGGSQK